MGSAVLWPLCGGVLAVLALAGFSYDLKRRGRGSGAGVELSDAMRGGTREHMARQARRVGALAAVVAALLWAAQYWRPDDWPGWRCAAALVLGTLAASLAGWAGLALASRANCRALESANSGGIKAGLGSALAGAAAMGLGGPGIGLLGLALNAAIFQNESATLASFVLGACLVAACARSGSAVYAKGSNIAADLAGRDGAGAIPPDDARNPAAIAAGVGGVLTGVAGLGGDLSCSFVTAIAAMTVIAGLIEPVRGASGAGLAVLPAALGAAGVAASLAGVLFARHVPAASARGALGSGAAVTGALMTAGAWFVTERLGAGIRNEITGGPDYAPHGVFYAVLAGLAAGAAACAASVWFTSSRFKPGRLVAESSRTGAVPALLDALRAGMSAVAAPALALAAALVAGRALAGTYGVAAAALGMASIAGYAITAGAAGAIAGGAAGLARMTHGDRAAREIAASLRAAGRHGAVMGRVLALGASAAVSVALLLAFIVTARMASGELALGGAKIVAGLLVGAALPQIFGAMLLGPALRLALPAAAECARQLAGTPGIREGKARPDYARCAQIAARGAARAILPPCALALLLPAAGFWDKSLLAGLLAGALAACHAAAMSAAIAGGAAVGARRCIEEGVCGGENSDAHRAAIIADATTDALKDTGPAVAALVRLMCAAALALAPLLR